MKHVNIVHEKLPKEARPEKGKNYVLSQNQKSLYKAEIVKYGGGCWATVKMVEPLADLPKSPMFEPGNSFDIRVAQYEFTEALD